MSDELRNELLTTLGEIRSKHTYFLMAAAGASLGFGVQKLDGQAPGRLFWFALAAMALWIISFAFGCRAVSATGSMVEANVTFVNRYSAGNTVAAQSAAALADSHYQRAKLSLSFQFGTLALGIVLFAIWRILLIFYPPYFSACIP